MTHESELCRLVHRRFGGPCDGSGAGGVHPELLSFGRLRSELPGDTGSYRGDSRRRTESSGAIRVLIARDESPCRMPDLRPYREAGSPTGGRPEGRPVPALRRRAAQSRSTGYGAAHPRGRGQERYGETPVRRGRPPQGPATEEVPMTPVGETMTDGCECAGEHDSIAATARRMAEIDVRAIPICGDDQWNTRCGGCR
jgi:hypothetical protein